MMSTPVHNDQCTPACVDRRQFIQQPLHNVWLHNSLQLLAGDLMHTHVTHSCDWHADAKWLSANSEYFGHDPVYFWLVLDWKNQLANNYASVQLWRLIALTCLTQRLRRINHIKTTSWPRCDGTLVCCVGDNTFQSSRAGEIVRCTNVICPHRKSHNRTKQSTVSIFQN